MPHSVQTSGLIEYFSPSEIAPKVTVCDCLKREITLQRVTTAKNDDCYLKIDSPAKERRQLRLPSVYRVEKNFLNFSKILLTFRQKYVII